MLYITLHNLEVHLVLTLLLLLYIVPDPIVNITSPSPQTVGQSLTLQCRLITVSLITSRVEIVWRDSNNGIVQSTDNITSSMDDPLLYIDFHTIEILTTSYDNREIECMVVINLSPPRIFTSSIILGVFGKYHVCLTYIVQLVLINF